MEMDEYQKARSELSENILKTEDKMYSDLKDWYTTTLEEVMALLPKYNYDTRELLSANEDIKQIIEDNKIEYITIISENINNIYSYISDKTNEITDIKLRQNLTDTLTNKYDETAIKISEKARKKTNNKLSKRINWVHDKTDLYDKYIDELKPSTTNIDYSALPTIELPSNQQSGVTLDYDIIFTREPNEEVIEYMNNKIFPGADTSLQKLSDELYDIIIKKTEIEGKNSETITGDIRDRFEHLTEYQARRIARTETHTAQLTATYNRLQSNPTVEYVMWVAVGDELTRDSHMEQDGMITYIGNIFPNGCRYPGDPSGPVEEVVFCRCDIEAYYEPLGYAPPADADYWFEEDMIKVQDYSNEIMNALTELGFTDEVITAD